MTNLGKSKAFQLKPKAQQDLENIYEYSVQEFGQNRAIQYIRDLNAAFIKVTNLPSLGQDYGFVRQDILAYRVVSHIIFYRVSAAGIIIIRVLHQSMDYARHLK